MNTYATAEFPNELPTRSNFETEIGNSEPLSADCPILYPATDGADFGIGARISCSSHLNVAWIKQQKLHRNTTSWIDVIELYIDQVCAEEHARSVNVENATENLFEIRRLTGFTWNCLAKLLNVNRRTLNNWAKGTKIRDANRRHIAETLGVLRTIDLGSAELNSAALKEHHVLQEPNYFEVIRAGNYEIAKQRLSHGRSKSYGRQTTTYTGLLYGDFQPMMMHPDADGTEIIEPLRGEPEPVSRKRQIRRD